MSVKREKHNPFFNMTDAFKEKHCSVCFLARQSVSRFFDGFLYESVTDSILRDSIRDAGGFCEKHSWQMVSFGNPHGNSLVAQDLLITLRNKLDLGEWHAKGKCPACQAWDKSEKMYIDVFVENFGDLEFRLGFQKSFGLCHRHFIAVKGHLKKEQQAELHEIEFQKLTVLLEELGRFINKFDYKHSHEGFGEDRDVWIRAVEFLKGRRDLLDNK